MKTLILVVGCSLLSFFPLKAVAAELNFDKLYVFGDSLSDIGNIYNVTTTANLIQPGIIPVQPPSPPYYQGRFSNGPNWVDDFASSLGLTITPSTQLTVGSPVTPNLQINYNYGGATARQSVDFAFGSAGSGMNNASSPVLPGILTEVQSYTNDLKVANQPADPNALYIVWEGGLNDYRSGAYTSPEQPTTNIVKAVTSLYDVGARNVLVVNEPKLGQIPVVAASGASNANYLSQLSLETDAELLTKLNDLRPTLSDINLVDLDANALFQSVINAPTSFGLTNVTDACLVTTSTTFSICENPNSYLFWDDRHPTAAADKLLAAFARETLEAPTPQPVPEPRFELSILLGLGLWLGLRAKSQKPCRQKERCLEVLPKTTRSF